MSQNSSNLTNSDLSDWQKQLQERNKKLKKDHDHNNIPEQMDLDSQDDIDIVNTNNEKKDELQDIESRIDALRKEKSEKLNQIKIWQKDIDRIDNELKLLLNKKNKNNVEEDTNNDSQDDIDMKEDNKIDSDNNQINTDEELARQLQSQFERENEENQQHRNDLHDPFNLFGMNRNELRENPNISSRSWVDDNGTHVTYSYSSNNPNGNGFSFISRSNRSQSNNENEENNNNNSRHGNDMFNLGINPFLMREISGNSDFGNINDNRNPFNFISPVSNLNLLMGGGFHGMSVLDRDIDNMSYEELLREFPQQPRGANQQDIERLPTDKFHETKSKNDNNNNNNNEENKKNEENTEHTQCCICLEKFKEGDNIRRLPCLHIFHTKEIDEWLRRNHVCPICRTAVDES